MKANLLFYYSLLLIVLFFSCSGTPTSDISSKVEWSQLQAGNWGEKLNYEVEVENLSGFTITGYVEFTIECYDGKKFDKKVKFSEIAAFSTSKEDGSMDVDNKKVDDAEIKEESFTIK